MDADTRMNIRSWRMQYPYLYEGARSLPPGAAELIVEGRRCAPWNEQWRCDGCHRDMLTKIQTASCPYCGGGTVQELWTEHRAQERMLAAVHKKISQVHMACAQVDGLPTVVGLIELRRLGQEHLDTGIGAPVVREIVQAFDKPGLKRPEVYHFVQNLVVAPAWRGNGIGAHLMMCAIKRAQPSVQEGVSLLSLSSRSSEAARWFSQFSLATITMIDDRRVLIGARVCSR